MTEEQTAAIERISAGLPTVFSCRVRTQSFRDAIHLTDGECEIAFPVELLAGDEPTAFFACPISSPDAGCASAPAQDGGA